MWLISGTTVNTRSGGFDTMLISMSPKHTHQLPLFDARPTHGWNIGLVKTLYGVTSRDEIAFP